MCFEAWPYHSGGMHPVFPFPARISFAAATIFPFFRVRANQQIRSPKDSSGSLGVIAQR